MEDINNSEKTNIDRGVELILRKKGGKNRPELDSRQFYFGKIFSLFEREIHFKIELSVIEKT
jgi:hypothetical protein